MANLTYSASYQNGEHYLVVSNGEKQVEISDAQVLQWHKEIDQKAFELYPETKRILSPKGRENMIRARIERLFE